MARKQLTRLTSLLLAIGLMFSGTAVAATKKTTTTATPQPNASNGAASDNGLRITPVRSDLTISAGSSQTVKVTVTNVTSDVSSYQVIVNDFVAPSDESGQPQILLDASKFASSHSLKRIVGSVPNVTLQPGKSADVTVPIVVPANYAAGGYYGAVRFVPHTDSSAAGKQVTLSASVASLVLVTVPGNISEQVSVASLDARKSVTGNNIDVARTIFTNSDSINGVIRFQNGGDIQEQPYGKLLLKNWRGNTLATYEINNGTPRGNVLPDSIRKFSVPLTKLGGFGKYTLEGNFGYGNAGQLITAKTSFYIIPVPVMLLGVLIVAFVLYLIFGLPRTIKWYNRRVVRRSQSNRRKR